MSTSTLKILTFSRYHTTFAGNTIFQIRPAHQARLIRHCIRRWPRSRIPACSDYDGTGHHPASASDDAGIQPCDDGNLSSTARHANGSDWWWGTHDDGTRWVPRWSTGGPCDDGEWRASGLLLKIKQPVPFFSNDIPFQIHAHARITSLASSVTMFQSRFSSHTGLLAM